MENDSIFYFSDTSLPLKKVEFPLAAYSAGTLDVIIYFSLLKIKIGSAQF